MVCDMWVDPTEMNIIFLRRLNTLNLILFDCIIFSRCKNLNKYLKSHSGEVIVLMYFSKAYLHFGGH